MERAGAQSQCAEELLVAAEELRLRRDAERGALSKSQLKKARRKLGKLYQQALINGAVGTDGGEDSTAYSMHATCDGSACTPVASQLCPAISEHTTDASVTVVTTVPAAAPAVAVCESNRAGETPPDSQHLDPPQGRCQQTGVQAERRDEASVGGPTSIAPRSFGPKPAMRPPIMPRPGRGRGRAGDMSAMVRVLQAQLGTTGPGAPGACGDSQALVPPREAVAASGPLHPGPQQPGWCRSESNTASKPVPADSATGTSTAGATAAVPPSGVVQPGQATAAKPRIKRQFVYGNYYGYYGYRHASLGAFEDDPRVALLRPEWVADRHLLDVGCNEGLVTLAAAMRFGAASATGVDIDAALVGKACRNVRNLGRSIAAQLRSGQLPAPHVSTAAGGGELTAPATAAAAGEDEAASMGTEQQQIAVGPVPDQTAAGADDTGMAIDAASPDQDSEERQGRAVTAQPVGAQLAVHDDGEHRSYRMREDVEHEPSSPLVPAPTLLAPPCPDAGAEAEDGAEPLAALGSGQATAPPGPQGRSRAAPGRLAPRPLYSWPSLRTAARAVAHSSFFQQDWVNQAVATTVGLHGQALGQQRLRTRYGTIFCLSVTKWVHLNWGDDGLLRLFRKFNASLNQGGFLVLEPQPWRSYRAALNKKATAGVAIQDLGSLKVQPEQFIDVLTQDMGFELVAELNSGSSAVGFDRPMYVLQKVRGLAGGGTHLRPALQLSAASGMPSASEAGSAGESRKRGGGAEQLAAGSSRSSAKRARRGGHGNGSHRRQARPEDLLAAAAVREAGDSADEADSMSDSGDMENMDRTHGDHEHAEV